MFTPQELAVLAAADAVVEEVDSPILRQLGYVNEYKRRTIERMGKEAWNAKRRAEKARAKAKRVGA